VAYDEGLAERISSSTQHDTDVRVRKMFGGLCYAVNGNMCFGVIGDELMVRVGTDGYEEALTRPHAREMDFSGRSQRGMVFVAPKGLTADADLRDWLERGLSLARSLPPK
jgi:TfoX/Sxy family transcriptional regulator of competence genes